MQEDDRMDEIITQHAIFKIMDSNIVPCSCGGYRKVIQNNPLELLVTKCSKCNTIEPFNISDLAFIGGALLKLAFAEDGNAEIKPPNVTYEQVFQMIEDIQNHEDWTKEIEYKSFRQSLKILNGGLSK
jgi:hypothetical protein